MEAASTSETPVNSYQTTGRITKTSHHLKRYKLQHASSTSPSDLLIFNVTCMEQTEEVHLAQLHLHRRRLPRHHHSNHYSRRVLLPPYRVRLYQILQARRTPGRARSSPPRAQNARPTRARTMLLASVPVPQATRGGWHALDITPVLRELLLNAQGPVADLMLGVRFEAPKGRPISPEHFLRDPDDGNTTKNNVAAPAFLVVFSEDGSDNGLMDDSGETQLQTPPSHTHAMAKMLQTAGGEFLKGVKSVPKHPLTIKDTEINISNKTRNDDFYIEASDNGHENNEVDASLRQNHKSKTPKGNRTHVDEDGNSIEFGNHQIHARKDPLQEKKRIVLRRRMYLKTKIHSSEDKFDSKKRNLKESNKKPYVSETNEVELAAGERSSHRRVVRSILDNELPDEYPRPTKSVPRTSPGTLLQGRRNGNVAHGKDDANMIPLPPGGSAASNGRWRGGRRRRRGRGRKRGEHKKRSRKLPENWQHVEQDEHWRQNDAELDSSSGSGEGVPTCRRHKLEVKFADIGWSDWIISPQTFEAHYCAGSCPFPLTKPSKRRRSHEDRRNSNEGCALKPTNHATIQSLVHAIGMQPDVPAPCCVPDHLSPMTLLYMDDAGNVVLKNYPAMSVDTCSCR